MTFRICQNLSSIAPALHSTLCVGGLAKEDGRGKKAERAMLRQILCWKLDDFEDRIGEQA